MTTRQKTSETMKTEELVREHRRLVSALRSHDPKKEDAEARRQEKELNRYEHDMKKTVSCRYKKNSPEGMEKARVDDSMSPKTKRIARDERRVETKGADKLAARVTSKPGVSKQGLAVRSKLARSEEQGGEDLEKGKNKREQRAAVFGNDANGGRTSDKRVKMMRALKEYMANKHGLNMTTASGKRDEEGNLRSEPSVEKQPYDVFSAKGVEQEKARQAQIDTKNAKLTAEGKKPVKRVDPKPDWRSGDFETQPSPDAAVHEVAHFYGEKPGQTLGQMQTRMDDEWGESQSKHGHMQQKKTKGEIQPMSLENKIRRRLGLPPNRSYKNAKPMSEHDRPVEQAIDASGPRFVRGQAPGKDGPKSVDYDRQSRLASRESKDKLDMIDRGEVVYDPTKGWTPGTSVNSKINQRAREKSNDMTRKDFETLQRSEQKVPPMKSDCKYTTGNGSHMRKSEDGRCWYCNSLKRKG